MGMIVKLVGKVVRWLSSVSCRRTYCQRYRWFLSRFLLFNQPGFPISVSPFLLRYVLMRVH